MTAVIDMVALFLAFILFALSAFLLAEVVAAFIARPERPCSKRAAATMQNGAASS